MEEVMKRQFRNAISSLVIAAFAGIGLVAFGQNPHCPCPQPVVPVQPVVQTVEQTCPQPVVQTVEQTCPQPVVQTVEQTCETCTLIKTEELPSAQPVVSAQPAACAQPVATAQTVACEDLCDLVKRIEKHADHLRKDFKDSLECLDCVDDSYYESVKAFEKATDRLKRHYRDDCDACEVADDVQEVLALANCISAFMDPCSLCPEAICEWTDLPADLQALAGQFCTTAAFQQPVSLQPATFVAQPTCVAPQPTCVAPQPVQVVEPPVQVVEPCPYK
jgi:hypothetical protein